MKVEQPVRVRTQSNAIHCMSILVSCHGMDYFLTGIPFYELSIDRIFHKKPILYSLRYPHAPFPTAMLINMESTTKNPDEYNVVFKYFVKTTEIIVRPVLFYFVVVLSSNNFFNSLKTFSAPYRRNIFQFNLDILQFYQSNN